MKNKLIKILDIIGGILLGVIAMLGIPLVAFIWVKYCIFLYHYIL